MGKQQMTIEFNGVEFDVKFYYEPAERMVMYYPDGTGHPGSPANVELEEITHQGTDFFELLDAANMIEKIENLILEQCEEY